MFSLSPFQYLQLLSSEVSGRLSTGVVTRVLTFSPPLSRDVLQAAWDATLRQYPALRVRLHDRSGEIQQEVRALADLPEAARWLGTAPSPGLPAFPPLDPAPVRAALLPGEEGCTRLLVQVHHALVDEQSLAVALDHLVQVALGRVEPGLLEEGDDAYRRATRAVLDASREACRTSGGYWRSVYGEPVSSAFADWRGAPPASGGRAEHYQLDIDGKTVAAWRSTARRANVSVALLLHAALAVTAHRYGRGDRLAIGTPLSVRDHPDIGFELAGLYLNVLPLVTRICGTDTLRDVLKGVRAEFIALQRHKFTPLNELPGLAGVDRADVLHSPTAAFGVTLAVHDALPMRQDLGVTVVPHNEGNPGSVLHVDIVTGVQGARIKLSWAEGARPWPDPEAVARHLLRVVDVIGQDPDTRVDAFPLVDDTEAERSATGGHTLTAPRRDEHTEPPGNIAAVVLDTCARTPSTPCLIDGGHTWTYADLESAVHGARALLAGHCLLPGSRVGVAFGRSRWQIVFALAAWLEGLTYVPLDARGPASRNRFLCEDADVRLVVGDPEQVRSACADAPCPVIGTDGVPAAPGTTATPRPADPESPAYIMYTSGSSGRPKGVVVTHGNLTSFMTALDRALPQAVQGAWLAETAPTFDISFVEMFWPLLHGRCVALSDPTAELAGPGRRVFFEHRQCTPSRARQILNARELGEPLGHWDIAPRTWFVGGETLSAALLADLRAAYPDTTFVNMYGPTEATIWSTYHVATGEEETDVPLGRPLDNTLLRVLDPYGHPAPLGAVGELLIAGDGVASGYLNRPEQTAVAFTHTATRAGTPDGHKLPAYRSGDRVVMGPDGALHFRGRGDGQVKVRGHRIELGEIERCLADDGAVADAVALVRGAEGGEELLAVMTARPGRMVDRTALYARLADRLPAAMVPSRLVVAAELPTLTSGKLDRPRIARLCADACALDALDTGRSETAGPVDAPATAAGPLASVLAEVAAEVIGRSVLADADFFAAGGNSLTALRFVAAARERGIQLHVRDVIEAQTFPRMADRANRTAVLVPPVTGPEPEAAGPVPLLPMQADFFATYDGDSNWFFTPLVMEVTATRHRGPALADRITRVLRRHQALAARFDQGSDGTWTQYIGGPSPLTCDHVRRPGAADDPGWVLAHLEEMRPLVDIRAGRPVVARLAEDERGRCLLFLLCHHLSVDALSLRHILDGVSEAVTTDREPGALEPAPAGAVIRAMRDLADSAAIRAELAAWSALPLAEGTRLPVDHPGAAHREDTSDDTEVWLEADETARLIRLAQRHGLQVGDLVTAATAAGALRLFDIDTIVLDGAIHGRDLPVPGASMTEAVGWFAVNVPLVLERRHAAAQVALERIREQLVPRYGRGHGYGLLKHMASDPAVRARLSGMPAPVVSSNYIGSQKALGGWPGLRTVPADGFVSYDPRATRSHLFDVDCAVMDDRLLVQTGYGAELFDGDTPRAFLREVRRVLQDLIDQG